MVFITAALAAATTGWLAALPTRSRSLGKIPELVCAAGGVAGRRGLQASRPGGDADQHCAVGNALACQAIVRDISERMAMEQERRAAAEALVSVADAGRLVISTNSAHTLLTGLTSQAMLSRRLDAKAIVNRLLSALSESFQLDD